MNDFSKLNLSSPLLKAIKDAGYSTPTPIQEKAIPAILMNRDILGCAQTGTGKTASFALPLLDILSHGRAKSRMPRSIVLSPTRELAAQIADNFILYGKYGKLKYVLLIGGTSIVEQERLIDRGADILIATPGRLLDHIKSGRLLLSDVKILVIDEADRMLDMGFIPDIETLIKKMPKRRQTIMLSATMPKEIRNIAQNFLDRPKEIVIEKVSLAADTITQRIIKTTPRKKFSELLKVLKQEKPLNSIIFCNRKRSIASLVTKLQENLFLVGALHGDMNQYQRMNCLKDFKENKIRILVCSDVAARGLDVANVTYVFNYDVPLNPEDYIHRIGRTGRANNKGFSLTFATDADNVTLQAIESLLDCKISVFEYKKEQQQEKLLKSVRQRPSSKNKKESTPSRKSSISQTSSNLKRGSLLESEQTILFGETSQVPNFLRAIPPIKEEKIS